MAGKLLRAVTRQTIGFVNRWSGVQSSHPAPFAPPETVGRKLGASCEARSLQGLIGFLSELHSLGIDLASHQQGIDTTTPAGRAMFQMMGVFAEFERSMIVERVRESVRRWRLQYSGSPRAHDASVGTVGEHSSSSVDRLTPITTTACNKRQHRENESIWRFTMAVKISMNAMIGAIVLALGLTSPIVAQSACIDEPCPAPRNPTQSAGGNGIARVECQKQLQIQSRDQVLFPDAQGTRLAERGRNVDPQRLCDPHLSDELHARRENLFWCMVDRR
jgi:hypothetical protein